MDAEGLGSTGSGSSGGTRDETASYAIHHLRQSCYIGRRHLPFDGKILDFPAARAFLR
ncbi:MAG: hypothetical protein Q9184_004411 [Pyrenodesmia sp. 2 TL-2023]